MSSLNINTKYILEKSSDPLAEELVRREFERHTELKGSYVAIEQEKSLQDAKCHLAHLAEAVGRESPSLFEEYATWVRDTVAVRNVLEEDLVFHLKTLMNVVRDQLPAESAAFANQFVTRALEKLSETPIPKSFVDTEQPLGALANDYLQSLLKADRRTASRLIMDEVSRGTSVSEIYRFVFKPSQHEVGRLWQTNKISVAQEHLCTAATQLIMSQLYPQIFAAEPVHGALVATGVSGDLHEIGIRMVSDLLQMDGWDTRFLGANVPTSDVILTLEETGARFLAISATMIFHVQEVEELINRVRALPNGQSIRILVGGYPFCVDSNLWKSVGADASARDADEAVAIVRQLKN